MEKAQAVSYPYDRDDRPEHHFVVDLLWKYFSIPAITGKQILLHHVNGSILLIDPQLCEPARSAPENWCKTKPDVWLTFLYHGIYCDGPVHLEGLSAMPKKNKVFLQDKEVNRWYEQAKETHSRIDSAIILEAMQAKQGYTRKKQLDLAAQLMRDIAEARVRRFGISLPTHYGDHRLVH